jgi:hypothetical protein
MPIRWTDSKVAGCSASWCLNHGEGPWPNGDWVHCKSPVTTARVIKFTDEAVVVLQFCDAHDELWALRRDEAANADD